MKVNSTIRTLLILVFLMLTFVVSAQEGFKDEEAMAKKADALFEKELYQKAYEYYQTLLSNHRDNTLYSYRFGVCMMFSDKKDKEKPIKYIEVAAEDPEMDIRVFYYLGRVYHQNYRFSEAKVAYQKYKTLAKSKAVAKFDIDRRIQECNNGLSLLSNIHLLYVINKVEVKETSFYRTYNMKSSGGTVIMKPDELITKYDKKHNKDNTAFYIPENRIIYYSSYGNKGINGKDIYRAHQLADGGWSEPQLLSSNINTHYDEAYPFITKDGSVLYFSSKGHNSMGGYDIFKSTFDPGLFSWSKPENMNFPINTPFNDIFYVPDTSSRFANFSSTRSSVEGLIYVYKIGTDKQEEEQDFAKVMKEGGDVTAAIKLIKDVADMKTNINIEEYKEKIAKISDTSITETANIDSSDNIAIKPAEVAVPIANINESDAVDSIFSSYRELQYRIIGLKKQQASIRKVYRKNKQLSEEILANQGSEGQQEAKKYQQAAKVANEIDVELSQEIATSEWASNKMIELASNMQYYQSNGDKDSVIAIYNRAVTLRNRLIYKDNYSDDLLNEQSKLVKNQREKASKLYELSQSYDNEIESLKAERDEYIAEEANTIDEAEKSDYKELISEMDKAISKKEAAKEKAIKDWKTERQLADNLSEQVSYTQKSLTQYNDETKDVDFKDYSYLKAEDIQSVDAAIAVVQNSKSNTLIDVSEDKESIVVANNDIETSSVIDEPTDTSSRNNELALNESAANESNLDSLNSPNEEEIDYLEETESKELLSEIDLRIDMLKEEEQKSKQKALIAYKLADKKYAEYQKLNDNMEADYSKLVLDNSINSDEHIQKLNKLKQNLIEANKLKKEAASAYSIAQVYNEESINRRETLQSFKEKKNESIKYIQQGEIAKAKEISTQISNYVAPSVDTSLVQSNKESISKLTAVENGLKYKQDSLDIIIAKYYEEQEPLSKESDAFITISENIKKLDEQKNEIALQLDVVSSNKESLQQINAMQNRVVASSLTGNVKIDSSKTIGIPEEMRTKENLVAAFSNQQLNRQLKSIDESIVEIREEEEVKQTVAQLDTMDVLAIPIYASAKQNEAAQTVVKPIVDAIKETQKQNEKLDKLTALTLLTAKDYNSQYQVKGEELQKAYAKIDTTLSREEQSEKIAKVEQLELEQLELNKKQEAAIQYVNILKKEHAENNHNIELLTQQLVTTKVLIAKNQIDSAENIDKQELMIANLSRNNEDYLANHLEEYHDENEVINDQIASLQQNSDRDAQRKIDSLNTIILQNNTIVAMIEEQAKYSDDEQKLAKVDHEMIEKSALFPIVSVNHDIFNPDYLQSHSVIASLELPSSEDKLDGAVENQHNNEPMELAVITANRVNRNEIPYVKQALVQKELIAINDEISVLSKIQDESLDQDEIATIEVVIVSLKEDKSKLNNNLESYQKEIAKIESKGYKPNINLSQLDIDQFIADLGIMKDSLLLASQQLRNEADTLKGKEKRARLSKAEENDKIAFALGLDAVDIVAQRNNKTYHENNVAIAKQSTTNANGFDIPEAKSYAQAASQDKNAALERRRMLAEGGFSEEEADKIIKEAEDYEKQSIINQNKALQIYETGSVIAQSNDASLRASEEIPFDKTDIDTSAIAENNVDTVISTDIAMQEATNQLADDNKSDDTENMNIDESQNANALVVVPVLTPSQKDSVDEVNRQAAIVDNQSDNTEEINTNEAQNANELVVVPVLTPSQKDSVDEVNKQTAIADNQGAQVENNANSLAIEQDKVSDNNNQEYTNDVVVLDNGFGISTETKDVVVNKENDIPDNSELLPIGLVFKVQMAAFKRKVPLSTFKGISPVAAEHIPNSSFIRYVGGIFPNYNYAKPARDLIRNKGFKDAFIVAYFDGKRISIAQARKLIASGRAYTSKGLTQFAIRNNTNYYVLSDGEQRIAANEKTVAGIPSIEATEKTSVDNLESVSSAGMGIAFDKKQNATDSIPTNKSMEGLVFKVQIEALKQDVSLDYFKGINPIWKENRPNSDLNYYIAGAFPNYVNAAEARDRIHSMGYPGAFIVVYFNGQRVSTEDANQLINENKAFTTPSLAKYAIENNTAYYSKPNQKSNVLTIYYSVQIGVFGSPRSADRLLNLSGLYFNRTNKGYYRYFSGKYTNEKTAMIARNQIRSKGIRDAYVVAFQNGKLISVNNARKLETNAKEQNIAISRNGAESKVNISSETNKNEIQVKDVQAEQGISFKVQLGAYKGTRNSAQLKVINSMSENGISSYSTASGLTIYFTNSYKTYQEAKAARARIIAAGHTDVFVVAIQNGSKISVRKALDIIGNK